MVILGVALLFLLIFGLLFWASLSSLKRRRLMEDLPTSKTAGVFIGHVELKGTAESESPFTSFLAAQSTVWYSWTVQERWSRTRTESYTDSDGKRKTRTKHESGWKTVASGGETSYFYLQDDLGAVRVDPTNAEIISRSIFNKTCRRGDPMYYGKGPKVEIIDTTGERWFTENAIVLHQPIYLIGQSRVRDDCVAPEITYDRNAPMFLISSKTEEQHRNNGLWKFFGFGIFAVVLSIVFGYFISVHLLSGRGGFGNDELKMHLVPWGIGLVMLLFWGIGWFWTVYNSMIGLRNRQKMAGSNVDIELKRRHELIGNLMKTVEGFRSYEREVQELLAILRTHDNAETAETQNNPMRACSKEMLAVIEKYPNLNSEEIFMRLHKELVKTEQRIALARTYYNDVIEAYNNRCTRFPESVIAGFANMHEKPFLQAEGFERAPLNISLVR